MVKTGSCAIALVVGMALCCHVSLAQKQGNSRAVDKDLQRRLDNMIFKDHTLKLGFEVPGASVDLVVKGVLGMPKEAWEYLYLTHGSQSFFLRQLNDLRHHVRITDEPSALRYVRLLTSPETYYLWRGQTLTSEITEAAAAIALPNYGLKCHPLYITSRVEEKHVNGSFQSTDWWYNPDSRKIELTRYDYVGRSFKRSVLKTMDPPDFSILGDGTMGVISHKAFEAGKFSPPVVLLVNGGFQVTRWLLVGDKRGDSVQKVQEFVGYDGEYRQTILKTISPPPILPDTRFTFLYFE